MASKKITAMPNLAGAQVPTDLATLVDLSAVPASQNVKSTLNDLFAEITKNITDLSVQFGDGAAASVSAVSKGKIRYNATAQAFQVSESAGAYASLLKGAGAAGQVGYFAGAATLAGSNNLFYDSANVRLGVGVGTSPAAPVHVAVDGFGLAVRITEAAATLDSEFSASGGVAFLGTTTTHPLELWTDGTTRVRIETSGVVGINTTTPGAQLDVVSGAAGTVGFIVSSAASPSVNIVTVRQNATAVFQITSAGAIVHQSVNLTTGDGAAFSSSTISSGNVVSIAATGTAAASNTKTALNVSTSGANATSTQTTYGAQISNTSTGTSSTNVALSLSASGGTNNYALVAASGLLALGGTTASFTALKNGTDFGYGITMDVRRADDSNYANLRARYLLVENDFVVNSTTGRLTFSTDLILRRAAAANLAFGSTDAAAPVAQTLSVQNVVAGTSNTAGANWTFAGSRGTGMGTGGAFVWQIAPAGSTGTSQNALVEAMRLSGEGGLRIGPSTATQTGSFTVLRDSAATNSIVDIARLGVNSTGTAAAGFGGRLSFSAETSTTADTVAAAISWLWTNATHAFRTSALTFSLVNLAATLTEYGRWTPDTLVVHAGTNPTVYTSGSAIVKFYVIDDVTPPMAVNAFFTATAGSCARFQTLRGRGSNASPAAVQNGDALGAYEFVGMYSTTANSFAVGARIVAAATETWSLTANGTDLQFHVANNGGTIVERMTLTRTGTLRINPNGAYSGFTTNTLLQVGNYASWNNATIAGIFAQSSSNRVLDLVGTLGQTADIIKAFNDTASVDLFNLTAAGIVASVAGASTSQVRHGGVLRVNTTAASNTGTGATDLISYSLPASTLGTNNDFIEIEAWGTYAANANNKTVTLEFGATTLYTTGAVAQNGGAWSIKARVVRTGATTQDAIATIIASGSVGDDATFTTPAETLSSAVTIKCTATGGASSDITQEGLIVKWYPAN